MLKSNSHRIIPGVLANMKTYWCHSPNKGHQGNSGTESSGRIGDWHSAFPQGNRATSLWTAKTPPAKSNLAE